MGVNEEKLQEIFGKAREKLNINLSDLEDFPEFEMNGDDYEIVKRKVIIAIQKLYNDVLDEYIKWHISQSGKETKQ